MTLVINAPPPVLPPGLPIQEPPAAVISGFASIHAQRLLPFIFSDDERFILIFHDRIVSVDPGDGGGVVDEVRSFIAVMSPEGREQAALECPYLGGEWFDVQHRQINDVMFLAHPGHPPHVLRREVEGWFLGEMVLDYPPLLDENLTGTTLAYQAGVFDPDANVWRQRQKLVSNVDFFTPEMAGVYFELSHKLPAASVSMSINTDDDYYASTATFYRRRYVKMNYYAGHGTRMIRSYVTSRAESGYAVLEWSDWVPCSVVEYNEARANAFNSAEIPANNPNYVERILSRWSWKYGDPVPEDVLKVKAGIAAGFAWQADINTVGADRVDTNPMGGRFSEGLVIEEEWNLTSSGYWNGILFLDVSYDDGATWENIRKYESRSDRNVNQLGKLEKQGRMRIRFLAQGRPFDADVWTPPVPDRYSKPNARLESGSAEVKGIVEVSAYVSPTEVECLIVTRAPYSGDATGIWREAAWSGVRGYPAAVGMYEQRIFWANTRSRPNTIWASAIDDFYNFKYGDRDSDAFVITLAATEQNGIMWLDSLRRFHAATKSRDFSITGGEQDGAPVSATSLLIRSESVSGATNAQPVAVNDALLFVARHGVRVHELAYSLERDGYVGNDISMLAPQLLEAGVLEIAYARQPDPVLYCLCRDGSLAAFTYAPAEKVNAWARVRPAEGLGAVTGICVLPGALGDELWVCASGVVMRMGMDRGVEAGVHLDCAVIITNDGNANGALHDWGVFADDLAYPFEVFDAVVFHSGGQRVHFRGLSFSENGALYFPREVKGAQRCVIGLPYAGELETMPVDAVFQDGPVAGMIRRIVSVTPNFYETVSCRIGRREAMPPVNFRTTADRMDSVNAPFSGYTMPLAWPAGSSRDETIRVVQDLPFPCTLLGMAVKWEVMG